MNGRSRREYLEVIYSRYRRAEREEKQVILNEFVATRVITGNTPSVC